MKQIEPSEVHERIEAGEKLVILDVRNQSEVDYCKIEGSIHIPMMEIPNRLEELKHDDAIVVYCHTGIRSLKVAQFLTVNGFKKVSNLRGGIDEWSRQVDPTVPTY